MANILVTGGAGYIGSHTAKLLAYEGFQPVVLDDLSTGFPWTVRWGPLIRGSLADGCLVRQVLRQYRIEAVIHLAGSAYVGESTREPRKYFRNNVVNTLNLLDAMVDEGIESVVFSSSCATYGAPEVPPLTEEHPQHPMSPYGESKLFVERALCWYRKAYPLCSVALRYFNAAGADPEGELGELHHPETHLIPLTIEAARGQRPGLEIYGTDYPTTDGTAVRDYVHVMDLAQAHLQALRYLLRGGESTEVNLGTGRGHSVREIIGAVERVAGRKVCVREGHRRSGDPPALVADASRAHQLLEWTPRFPDLESMVETAWRWNAEAPSICHSSLRGATAI